MLKEKEGKEVELERIINQYIFCCCFFFGQTTYQSKLFVLVQHWQEVFSQNICGIVGRPGTRILNGRLFGVTDLELPCVWCVLDVAVVI